MGGEALGHPGQVVGVGDAVEQAGVGCRQQHQLDAVDDLAEGADRLDDGPGDVDERLPVDRVGGVEVDEAADPVGGPVGRRPVITMPP